jgi:hypothetical protein
MIITDIPMMLSICQYKYNGLQTTVNQICGRAVNLNVDQITVASRACEHTVGFPLIPWRSRAYATGNWNCPVCHRALDLGGLLVRSEGERPFALAEQKGQFGQGSLGQSGTDIFQSGSDPFTGSFDWEGF